MLKRTEITTYANELLTKIIYQNLTRANEEKKQGEVKYTRKKISYSLQKFNLFLLENGVKFAIFRIEQLEGTHTINSQMESEIGIDVHMVRIENYVDSDQYRVVLCPLLEGEMKSFEEKNSMLRLRLKDGYVKGMIGAPWKMYDQFELYVFPINFKLTKNFYRRLKAFFIPTSSLEEVKNDPIYRQKSEAESVVKPYAKLIAKEDQMFRSVLESPKDEAKGEIRSPRSRAKSQAQTKLKEKEKKEAKKATPDKSVVDPTTAADKKIALPSFFKYLRLNEVSVNLTFSSGTDIHVLTLTQNLDRT
ncbi:MAG: hypothetical protein P4M11_13010 [Candidatus Pacebacteria bacterium]|nr:hypothetical protein [Candidatus Paceibacterota bacterium]